MNKFKFSPENGLLDEAAFPTNPTTQQEARGQVQTPMNQLRDYINNVVYEKLQEWENFKNKGGEIEGDLKLINNTNQSVLSLGYSSLTDKSMHIGIKDKNTDATIGFNFNLIPGVSSSITPLGKSETELGKDDWRWKEIWVGSSKFNTNGYTHLTNGLLMQWGETDVSIGTDSWGTTSVTLPVNFSNTISSLATNIISVNSSSDSIGSYFSNAEIKSNDKIVIHARHFAGYGQGRVLKIKWLAIGY